MSTTAVSLFAGVGGFDLALQRNGVEVVAAVEIDKNARGVLARHFPETKLFNDVTEVTGEQLRDAGFVPERGILTGGFPCQDLSVAGKRAGLVGQRSGLFWEIMRLADELRPKWLILENVPGLLSSNGGRDFGTVLGAMAERGYGFAYRILDSQHFGVAQRRRRVFIVGCLGDDGTAPGEVLALREGVRGHPAPSRETGKEVAAGAGPGVANTLGTKRRHDLDQETCVARTLTARHDSSPDGDRGFNIVPVLLTMREGKDGGGKGPLVSEDQSLTLATGNGQVLIQPYVKVIRSGARDENGDLPPEVWAERDLAPTLNVMDNTGESRATVLAFSHNSATEPDGDRGFNIVPAESTVRRLTPIECTRLQGFPDSWQEIDNANATEAHADQILRRLWLSAYEKAREGWRPGISAALLTPEILLAGVHGNWVSWEVAGECVARRGALQGAESWPEGFLLEMRRCSEHRPSPYQRESFGQLARELGRSLSEMPLGATQAREVLLGSELWTQASEEWPLRYARSETEAWSSPRALADSARYKQMGNAVTVNVVEWIVHRLVAQEESMSTKYQRVTHLIGEPTLSGNLRTACKAFMATGAGAVDSTDWAEQTTCKACLKVAKETDAHAL